MKNPDLIDKRLETSYKQFKEYAKSISKLFNLCSKSN